MSDSSKFRYMSDYSLFYGYLKLKPILSNKIWVETNFEKKKSTEVHS